MGYVKINSPLTEKEWTFVVAGLENTRDVFKQLGSDTNAEYVEEIIGKVLDIKDTMQGGA